MTEAATLDLYGVLTEPATLTIQRLLPGPIERVWSYLTKSELRRQWLAAGEMELRVGAPFAFTWRNSELTDPPGERPEGFGEEHTMQSRITELDPPHTLSFAWDGSGDVTLHLEPRGDEVMLTVIHRRLPRRSMMLGVSGGWHAHLDMLAYRLRGEKAPPFWDHMVALRKEYDRRIPPDQN
jgi:uncharacterized protein YndB with AHSA1/START domain